MIQDFRLPPVSPLLLADVRGGEAVVDFYLQDALFQRDVDAQVFLFRLSGGIDGVFQEVPQQHVDIERRPDFLRQRSLMWIQKGYILMIS